MQNDWLYSEDRLAFREQCLSILLRKYGSELDDNGEPLHSCESIYGCAHDWVSQGNPEAAGIINHYKTHYKG